jgi:hypothetical protein
MGSSLEGGGIAFETGMMASQELFFQHRTAALAHRGGMMLGHGVACIALVDQPRMSGDLHTAPVDPDFGRVLVDGHWPICAPDSERLVQSRRKMR